VKLDRKAASQYGPPSFSLSFHYKIRRNPAALGPSLWAAKRPRTMGRAFIKWTTPVHDSSPNFGPRSWAEVRPKNTGRAPAIAPVASVQGETSGGDHACGRAQETYNWGGACAGRLTPISVPIQLTRNISVPLWDGGSKTTSRCEQCAHQHNTERNFYPKLLPRCHPRCK
jgi:hypothetical protein